jgi:Domain of unknown function (DUF4272)
MDEPRRPEPAEVARRILVLSALCSRLRVELAEDGRPEAVRGISDWLRGHDLHESASLAELKLINTPLRKVARDDVKQYSWRTEACGILVWAVGRLRAIPAWDALVPPDMLVDALADAHGDPRAFVRQTRLRPDAEIEAVRETATLWHWRTRMDGRAARQLIAETAHHAHAGGAIGAPIDGDFPALGRAFRELDEREARTVRSLAVERHHALNWIMGHSPGADWESTPTDP